jgi:glycosyltransferase involved in cell wall biosynthesis
MRVMLVSQHYPPDSYGGVENYTQRLAAELVRRGDTVSIVARRPAAEPAIPVPLQERLPNGITLYRLTGGYYNFDRFLRHHQRLEQLFTDALLTQCPDVVHFNHLKSQSPRFVEIAHRLGTPVVISLHDFYFACPLVHLQKPTGELCSGPDFGRECARTCFANQAGNSEFPNPNVGWGLRALYYRQVLGLADRLIAGSRYVASYFENMIRPRRTVEVIPNGVEVEVANGVPVTAGTEARRGTLNLVFCGTVSPVKGPQVIVEALKLAGLPSVQLLLMGQTPDADYLRQMQDQAQRVPGLMLRVHGEFQPTEFSALIQDADCAIVPTVVPEAGPQVPREMLARGVPVIASRLGALPEVVTEGENGLTFDPAQPGELAAILQRLAKDQPFVSRLREGASRTPVITVAGHADAIRAVYQEVINNMIGNRRKDTAALGEFRFLHEALITLGYSHP